MNLQNVIAELWRALGVRRAPRSAKIMLASGREFDLLNPQESVFDVHDIAHSLANTCRFTGHCERFYSVAQHSLMVSLIVPEEWAWEGLLHDAAEAIIGDVAKPLKNLIPDYRRVEQRIEEVIFGYFGIAPKLPACVKQGDTVMLHTEQRDLMGAGTRVWTFESHQPLSTRIIPMSPEHAKVAFLQRYEELARARGFAHARPSGEKCEIVAPAPACGKRSRIPETI
jgi:hypothetical protein